MTDCRDAGLDPIKSSTSIGAMLRLLHSPLDLRGRLKELHEFGGYFDLAHGASISLHLALQSIARMSIDGRPSRFGQQQARRGMHRLRQVPDVINHGKPPDLRASNHIYPNREFIHMPFRFVHSGLAAPP